MTLIKSNKICKSFDIWIFFREDNLENPTISASMCHGQLC